VIKMAKVKYQDNEQDKILARVDQKLDDLMSKVNEINTRVKETNGKVAEAHLKIAGMKSDYRNCPARKDKEKGVFRGWVQWIVPVGFNIISLVIVIATMGG